MQQVENKTDHLLREELFNLRTAGHGHWFYGFWLDFFFCIFSRCYDDPPAVNCFLLLPTSTAMT